MPEASATQTDTGQENHQQQRRIRPSRRGAPFAFDRSRLATTTTKAIGQRSPPQRQRLFSARAFSATQSRSPFANVDDDEPQPSTSNANPQLSNHRHQRGEANKSYVIDGLEEEEHGMENDEDAMREAERSMDHSQARQLQHNGSFGGEELSDIEDIEMGDMGRRPATADGQEDTAAIAEPRLSKLPRRFQRRRRKTTKRIGEELEDLGAAEGKMDEAGNKEEGTEAMFSRQTTVEANGVSTAPAVEPPDRKENVDGNAGAKNVSPRDVQSPPNQMRKPSNLQNGSIGSATATREVPLPPRPQITVTGPSDAQPERKVEEEPQQTTPTDQANSTTSVNPSLIKGLTKSISRFRGRNRVADAAAVEQANFMSKFGMSGATGVQTTHNTTSPNADTAQTQRRGKLRHLCEGLVFDANEGYFYHWNALVSTAYVYNLLVVIARIVFVELANGRLWLLWLSFDLVVDFVYLVDMFVRSRTGYLEQGLLVRDCRKIRALYVRSRQFLVDFASLLPLDYAMGVALWHQMPILRLNRLLRRERIQRFMEQTETRTSLPNAFRVGVVVWYIAVIIHWNACFYFLISEGIGLGSDGWVYGINNKQSLPDGINDTLTRRYIYSFYWSTLILTTIGEVPGPTQNLEFAFVTIDLMCGVLIFATIVGNVGSMIANISADRTDFQNRIDSIKQYMELRGVGKQLEVRVIKWFDYLWANKQGLTDAQVLKVLPDKLQAEIAMHVHFETLRKVRIFQDCEAGLLAELVLKLQLQVFSPADYVCRKGDIGREMYIVKRGMLQVVADDGVKVFATLSEGAVFGELSILNIAGSKNGNRRTANVRSVGYTDLFVLNKSDLWIALREYPEARKILINKGRELLRKDNLLDENAPEEQKTAEEISEELQSAIRVLQIRIARLIAEHTNTETKLRERIAGLEGRLRKYRALAANEH